MGAQNNNSFGQLWENKNNISVNTQATPSRIPLNLLTTRKGGDDLLAARQKKTILVGM